MDHFKSWEALVQMVSFDRAIFLVSMLVFLEEQRKPLMTFEILPAFPKKSPIPNDGNSKKHTIKRAGS